MLKSQTGPPLGIKNVKVFGTSPLSAAILRTFSKKGGAIQGVFWGGQSRDMFRGGPVKKITLYVGCRFSSAKWTWSSSCSRGKRSASLSSVAFTCSPCPPRWSSFESALCLTFFLLYSLLTMKILGSQHQETESSLTARMRRTSPRPTRAATLNQCLKTGTSELPLVPVERARAYRLTRRRDNAT